ncbi:nuclear transport factor 2 family protein [Amycolatopsis sp. NPDC004368]
MGSAFELHPSIVWKASEEPHPARVASWRAMNALAVKDRSTYLGLYAPTGGIEDPVGPSMYDATGEGHYGPEKLSAFWDNAIEPITKFSFVIADSFATGNEAVNVGIVTTALPDGRLMDVEGVFQYRVDDRGLLLAMRTFWELDRATATIRER